MAWKKKRKRCPLGKGTKETHFSGKKPAGGGAWKKGPKSQKTALRRTRKGRGLGYTKRDQNQPPSFKKSSPGLDQKPIFQETHGGAGVTDGTGAETTM